MHSFLQTLRELESAEHTRFVNVRRAVNRLLRAGGSDSKKEESVASKSTSMLKLLPRFAHVPAKHPAYFVFDGKKAFVCTLHRDEWWELEITEDFLEKKRIESGGLAPKMFCEDFIKSLHYGGMQYGDEYVKFYITYDIGEADYFESSRDALQRRGPTSDGLKTLMFAMRPKPKPAPKPAVPESVVAESLSPKPPPPPKKKKRKTEREKDRERTHRYVKLGQFVRPI